MAVVVQKFGGSSVADLDRIRSVAARVVASRREGHDVVVVVSAMGKTTDGLLALARGAAQDPATGAPGDAPRRELDMLVSTGERVTMALSIAVQALGQDAVSFTGVRDPDDGASLRRAHRRGAAGAHRDGARAWARRDRRRLPGMSRAPRDHDARARGRTRRPSRSPRRSAPPVARSTATSTASTRRIRASCPRRVTSPELDVDLLSEMAESGAKVLNARRRGAAERCRAARPADERRAGEGRDGRGTRRVEVGAGRVGLGDVALLEASARARSEPAGARLVEVAAELELPLLDVAADGARPGVRAPSPTSRTLAREAALPAPRAAPPSPAAVARQPRRRRAHGPRRRARGRPAVLARAGVRVHHLAAGRPAALVVDEAARRRPARAPRRVRRRLSRELRAAAGPCGARERRPHRGRAGPGGAATGSALPTASTSAATIVRRAPRRPPSRGPSSARASSWRGAVATSRARPELALDDVTARRGARARPIAREGSSTRSAPSRSPRRRRTVPRSSQSSASAGR